MGVDGKRRQGWKQEDQEKTAKPIQVRAGEPLGVGSGPWRRTEIKEVDKTRLGNQLDSTVREESQG